jgi:hypothetical protein
MRRERSIGDREMLLFIFSRLAEGLTADIRWSAL